MTRNGDVRLTIKALHITMFGLNQLVQHSIVELYIQILYRSSHRRQMHTPAQKDGESLEEGI
jgi:hypothetical protein